MFNKLNEKLKTAMKENNTEMKDFCRSLKAKIHEYLVANRLPRDKVDDKVFINVATSYKKSLQKAIDQLGNAEKATELVDQYKAEIALCEEFLPEALGEDEIRKLVNDAVEKVGTDMGKLMSYVMKNTAGLDGKVVKKIVNEVLSA